MSRNVVRATTRASRRRPRPRAACARARAPRRAARGSARAPSTCPFALVARVEREAEHAERVLLARPEQRRRHREVLVDARERHRLLRACRRPAAATARAAARRRRSGSRCRRACSRDLRLVEAGERAPCGARSGATAAACRTGSRRRRRPAPARRAGRSSSRSIGLQTEVSKKTPALPAKWPASPARSAMPAWAMISCASGIRVDEAREVVGDRRQPAAAVDQDRHAPLGREREHRREPLVVEQELLRARVELDPARAEVEAALRPPRSGSSVRSSRTNGISRPFERGGERERAVVRRAEAGMAVGLVEAEHEGARDAVAVHDPTRARRRSPTIPSMSSPRCVCASKMSAPSGSSARSSSSRTRRTAPARARAASLTP